MARRTPDDHACARFLKQLFEIAVKDRIIAESPCKYLNKPLKKLQAPIRRIPTVDQFGGIVRCIRSQPFTDHAKRRLRP